MSKLDKILAAAGDNIAESTGADQPRGAASEGSAALPAGPPPVPPRLQGVANRGAPALPVGLQGLVHVVDGVDVVIRDHQAGARGVVVFRAAAPAH